MKGIIRIGDKTTDLGTVLSGSTVMKFAGIGVVRKGDAVLCPTPDHGHTVITHGHPAFNDNVTPVAIPSLSKAVAS